MNEHHKLIQSVFGSAISWVIALWTFVKENTVPIGFLMAAVATCFSIAAAIASLRASNAKRRYFKDENRLIRKFRDQGTLTRSNDGNDNVQKD